MYYINKKQSQSVKDADLYRSKCPYVSQSMLSPDNKAHLLVSHK